MGVSQDLCDLFFTPLYFSSFESYLISEWSMTKMYSKGGIMKVRHVMELPPTRFRILPKLGTVSVIQVCVVFVT